MGGFECAGCTFIAFGPILAMFIITIARDPLRVILFVAGAFFWLLALLVSSLWWFIVVPLRKQIEFGLFFAVAFQEIFRLIYFILLQKAERGLQKVSEQGMEIEGIHSLKDAKHTIAYVCGVGFGFMSGAFSLVNVLADATGPGTVGFPLEAGLDGEYGHGTYTFFITSAISTSAFIFLHIFWNVLFFHGCNAKNPIPVAAVIMSHYIVSGLSLLNRRLYYSISLPLTYVIVMIMAAWALFVSGATLGNVRNFVFSCRLRPPPKGTPLAANGQILGSSSPEAL